MNVWKNLRFKDYKNPDTIKIIGNGFSCNVKIEDLSLFGHFQKYEINFSEEKLIERLESQYDIFEAITSINEKEKDKLINEYLPRIGVMHIEKSDLDNTEFDRFLHRNIQKFPEALRGGDGYRRYRLNGEMYELKHDFENEYYYFTTHLSPEEIEESQYVNKMQKGQPLFARFWGHLRRYELKELLR